MISALLLDLDGTLLDTAPDLATALNKTLNQHGRSIEINADFHAHIAGGSLEMLRYGFDIPADHPQLAQYQQEFLDHYAQCLTEKTDFFPGMEQVLNYCEQSHIPWGIITNKTERFTLPLLKHFALTDRAYCIISADTLKNKKPHPEPLLHACQLIAIEPSTAVYVGDSEVDVLAANAAGMPAITALYGYYHKTINPADWGAQACIQKPLDLLDILVPL